jgi:hypothetical protein
VIVWALGRHYMVMNALRLGALVAAGLLATLTSPARAGTVAGLTYRVPLECPSEAEFVAAVEGRGGRFDRLRSGEASRSLEISIDKGASGFRGSLQVRGKDGASDAREVYAEGCYEVVNGLAVVTAIALGGPRAVPASAPATPRADAASAPQVPAPPPDDRRLQALNLRGVDSIRVGAGTLGVNTAVTYSVSGGLAVGVVPSLVLPRYDLSISRANFVTPPEGRHYLVGNVIRARVSWLGDATYRSRIRRPDYTGTLRLIDEYQYDFPAGELAADAEVVAIEALATKGDQEEVARRAARFLARYPNDPHGAEVKRLGGR